MNREKLYEIRKQGKTLVVWVTSISLLVYLLSSFYQGRDEDGWIVHHATVNMLMSPEWLDGESRDCVADMTPHKLVLPYVVRGLRCPDATLATEGHTLRVAFWGQVERTKPYGTYYLDGKWHGLTMWRCVRKQDAFTCYAVN